MGRSKLLFKLDDATRRSKTEALSDDVTYSRSHSQLVAGIAAVATLRHIYGLTPHILRWT